MCQKSRKSRHRLKVQDGPAISLMEWNYHSSKLFCSDKLKLISFPKQFTLAKAINYFQVAQESASYNWRFQKKEYFTLIPEAIRFSQKRLVKIPHKIFHHCRGKKWSFLLHNQPNWRQIDWNFFLYNHKIESWTMQCPGALGNIQRKPLKKERSVFPDQIRLYHVHRVVLASKLMSD